MSDDIEAMRQVRYTKSMTQRTLPYEAPEFSLADQSGVVHTLSDYRGKWLVLYFYPKDDTPGCTVEACSLRDAATDLKDLDAEVVGVSADESASHSKFTNKHHLNFTLLSDSQKEAIVAYGAWGKKMFGKEGILRKTFIIDPEGAVVKVYGRVTPLGHGEQIVAALTELRAKRP